MLKHPKYLDTKTKVIGIKEDQIQPNAIDVSVDKIFYHLSDDVPRFFELRKDNTKAHLPTKELKPQKDFFLMAPGTYEIIMKEEVEIGEGEAGWLLSRSTLIRNGVSITSGLYDSGYKGVIGGLLTVGTRTYFKLERGAKVAQFITVESQSFHKYEGDYGNAKNHDLKKYSL